MRPNQQLEDDNIGSGLINSSEDEPTRISPSLKNQPEMIMNQMFHGMIEPIMIQNPRITETILIQKLHQIIDPIIGRVVKEQFEPAQATISSIMKGNEIHPLQLCFLIQPSRTVLTGKKIEGERGASIKVALIDGSTGETVRCGTESSAKVEIVALEGDCNDVEGHDWTTEDFNQKIVREREGKKGKIPLLTGDAYLNLKEGVGTVDKIKFTHNAKWMKNVDLWLGARVVLDNFSGIKVREAISEPFELKDRRSTLYGKHDTPSLFDDVWRLKKIAKDSLFHNHLSKENITTVKDFLILYFTNRQRLHEILDAGTEIVKIMIDHARTCKPDETVYLYHPSSQQKKDVVFNVVGEWIGLVLEGQYVAINKLSETQKADARNLVDSAFEQWKDFVSYDDITSLKNALPGTHPSSSPPCGHNSSIINGNQFDQPPELDDLDESAWLVLRAVLHPNRWRKVVIVLLVITRGIVRSDHHVQKKQRYS